MVVWAKVERKWLFAIIFLLWNRKLNAKEELRSTFLRFIKILPNSLFQYISLECNNKTIIPIAEGITRATHFWKYV